jgi:hypothetical protein
MAYSWPVQEVDLRMDEALDIALDYLEYTRQASPFSTTQKVCANAIVLSWRRGTRHRIRLANDAINAIEKKEIAAESIFESFYPRVS